MHAKMEEKKRTVREKEKTEREKSRKEDKKYWNKMNDRMKNKRKEKNKAMKVRQKEAEWWMSFLWVRTKKKWKKICAWTHAQKQTKHEFKKMTENESHKVIFKVNSKNKVGR